MIVVCNISRGSTGVNVNWTELSPSMHVSACVPPYCACPGEDAVAQQELPAQKDCGSSEALRTQAPVIQLQHIRAVICFQSISFAMYFHF